MNRRSVLEWLSGIALTLSLPLKAKANREVEPRDETAESDKFSWEKGRALSVASFSDSDAIIEWLRDDARRCLGRGMTYDIRAQTPPSWGQGRSLAWYSNSRMQGAPGFDASANPGRWHWTGDEFRQAVILRACT